MMSETLDRADVLAGAHPLFPAVFRWLRENGMLNINYGYDYLSSAGNGGGGRRYDTFQIEQQTARLIDSGEGSYREALWK